jgi:hypothetical protein
MNEYVDHGSWIAGAGSAEAAGDVAAAFVT